MRIGDCGRFTSVGDGEIWIWRIHMKIDSTEWMEEDNAIHSDCIV
jgi:hypothetical protein